MSASGRLSVLVATRDRAASLGRMLDSLGTEWPHLEQVLVVDNGSRDSTPELLRRRVETTPGLRALRRDRPGKSDALNAAIPLAPTPFLAFLDDDVLVRPGWARALVEAFVDARYAGFQGRVVFAEWAERDPARMQAWGLYRTFPHIDEGSEPRERAVLTGANMAIRREILERVGLFDERLGPGAAGAHEDTELALRIRAGGGRFLYVPGAVVEHEYDAERLCLGFLEHYYARLGKSRYVYKQNGLLTSVLPNILAAAVSSGLARAAGREGWYVRQRGKLSMYRAMLAELRRQRRARALARAGDDAAPG